MLLPGYFFLPFSAAFAAPTVICNDDDGPIWLSYVQQDGAAYRAQGWYRMEKGLCAGAEAPDGQPLWVYAQTAKGDEAFCGTHGFCITDGAMDNADVKFLGTGPMINYVPPGVGLKPCSEPRRVGKFREIAAKDRGTVVSASSVACTEGLPPRKATAAFGAGALKPVARGKQ